MAGAMKHARNEIDHRIRRNVLACLLDSTELLKVPGTVHLVRAIV
jgi:hypothetical protein